MKVKFKSNEPYLRPTLKCQNKSPYGNFILAKIVPFSNDIVKITCSGGKTVTLSFPALVCVPQDCSDVTLLQEAPVRSNQRRYKEYQDGERKCCLPAVLRLQCWRLFY